MADASESEIAKHISRLGLYRNKAKFLKKCAQQLLEDFDGQVPQTREELESLAGVGRKTANVVMSVALEFQLLRLIPMWSAFANTMILLKNQLHH